MFCCHLFALWFQLICSYVLYPFAVIMGVEPGRDSRNIARLIGRSLGRAAESRVAFMSDPAFPVVVVVILDTHPDPTQAGWSGGLDDDTASWSLMLLRRWFVVKHKLVACPQDWQGQNLISLLFLQNSCWFWATLHNRAPVFAMVLIFVHTCSRMASWQDARFLGTLGALSHDSQRIFVLRIMHGSAKNENRGSLRQK